VKDVHSQVVPSIELADTMSSGKQMDDDQNIPMWIQSHSYNVFMEQQECNIVFDCPNLKSPSHNQLFNLVAHFLDHKDVSSFLALTSSIKLHCPPDTLKNSCL